MVAILESREKWRAFAQFAGGNEEDEVRRRRRDDKEQSDYPPLPIGMIPLVSWTAG